MYEFKKILVPTDFSKASEIAFPFAGTVARKFGSVVDFFHVIPTLSYFNESMASLDITLDLEENIYPQAQEKSKHKLNHLMEDYLTDEHYGEALVQIAPKVSTMITEYAQKHNYDLIVMGSHGADQSSMLRGSVAEKVIRHSEVPVFTITHRSDANQLKRIIFPTDGSQTSFAAFPHAVSLAKVYDAEITLFHVIELYGTALDYNKHDPHKSESENVIDNVLTELKLFIDQRAPNLSLRKREEAGEYELVLQEGASSTTISLNTEVTRGVTAHLEIEEFAEEHSDMVVMTTHGHTGLARFFLGSTTEQIAQHLDKPVLTVKPPKDDLK